MFQLTIEVPVEGHQEPEEELLLFLLSTIQAYRVFSQTRYSDHQIQRKILESTQLLYLQCLLRCFPQIDLNNPEHSHQVEIITNGGFAEMYDKMSLEFEPMAYEKTV